MNWKCEDCGELNDEVAHRACWNCTKARLGRGDAALEILCSTTMEIPGRQVLESKGVVFGQPIRNAL